MVKSEEQSTQKPNKPSHGTNPGDKISGDRIYVECRKPRGWEVFRMSGNHNGSKTIATKNALAIVEQGYTNQGQ